VKINFKDSNIHTITINNFFGKPIDTGPLTETITIPCSKKFKEFVDFVCKLTEGSIEELGHRYLLQGMIRDMEDIFSLEPYLDKSLREVLDKSPQA
jgi:hypothetical protein